VASSPPLPPAPRGVDPPDRPDVAGSARPTEPHDGDERPPSRATVPILLALLLTVAVGIGAFVLVSWASGGGGCEAGAFESARFGYCARVPSGWIAGAARGEDTPLDRFMSPDGPATITVTAVPLTKGQDLARFEQFVRGYDEDAGAETGTSSNLEVGGVSAVAFDVMLEGPDAIVRSREVLFSRNGIAWRVTLADDEVGYDASLERLNAMLDSWHFI